MSVYLCVCSVLNTYILIQSNHSIYISLLPILFYSAEAQVNNTTSQHKGQDRSPSQVSFTCSILNILALWH